MKRSHLIAAATVAVAAALTLTACSMIPSGSSSPTPTASARGFGGGGGAAFPGASGLIAAVDGSTAQVQSTSAQTAVSWTSTTAFTQQVAGTSADVAVGSCIVARPATGTSTSTSSTTLAAATIEVVPETNGTCAAGLTGMAGGPGGRREGSGTPGAGQGDGSGQGARNGQGRPSGAPTPGAGGRGFAGFGVTGSVTAVEGGSITVSVQRFARSGATASPTPQASTQTVTWSSSTTFTKLQKADASAVVVGQCMTALGKTDDTGALTATAIAVTPPVNGSCSSGFGGRGQGGRGSGGGSGTGGSGNAAGSGDGSSGTTNG
jgi:hypothetical protein